MTNAEHDTREAIMQERNIVADNNSLDEADETADSNVSVYGDSHSEVLTDTTVESKINENRVKSEANGLSNKSGKFCCCILSINIIVHYHN